MSKQLRFIVFIYIPKYFIHKALQIITLHYIRLWIGNVVSDGVDWHHIAKSQMNGFIEKSY